MRIATWNVNSIRTRVERVTSWLERNDIDVLAIQETKCKVEQFPMAPFQELGYEVAVAGFNQWNGVAIASRVGISDAATSFLTAPPFREVVEPRFISAMCGGVRVVSAYVPNGRTLEDPHYEYKLEWLAQLTEHARQWVDEPTVLGGDWNVAWRDEDVWDMAVFEGATHVSPRERAALDALTASGYREVTREFTPDSYTYWDYQQLAFPKNKGMRIDLMFASESLASRVKNAWIDREERKGKGASDHVPVVIELDPAPTEPGEVFA